MAEEEDQDVLGGILSVSDSLGELEALESYYDGKSSSFLRTQRHGALSPMVIYQNVYYIVFLFY